MSFERGTDDEMSDETFFRLRAARGKKAMDAANFCPRCGGDPTLEWQDVGDHCSVFCGECGEVKGVGRGKTPAEAVAAWNALPVSFPCTGYGDCESVVGDEDEICAACFERNERENAGGCPGCGGSCPTACR